MVKSLLDIKRGDILQMTEQEANVFLSLSLMEQRNLNQSEVPPEELDGILREHFDGKFADSFLVQVMTKRLVAMAPTARFSPFALAFLALISDRVGVAVMWSYTMFDYYRRHNASLNMANLASVFPMGFPTDDAMHAIWDDQKTTSEGLGSDNLIDGREAWTI